MVFLKFLKQLTFYDKVTSIAKKKTIYFLLKKKPACVRKIRTYFNFIDNKHTNKFYLMEKLTFYLMGLKTDVVVLSDSSLQEAQFINFN